MSSGKAPGETVLLDNYARVCIVISEIINEVLPPPQASRCSLMVGKSIASATRPANLAPVYLKRLRNLLLSRLLFWALKAKSKT